MREIATRITAIRDTDELLQHVADEAARLLVSEGAIIDLLDPISGSIAVGYVAGLDPERTARWEGSRVGEDIVRRALSGRTALFTIDYLDDERFSLDAAAAEVASGLGLRSIAIAPLVSERGAARHDRGVLVRDRARSARTRRASSARSPTRRRSRS